MSKRLIEALNEYIKECTINKETSTFRGLIGALCDNGYEIDYCSAQVMGLLEFNNLLFDLMEDIN